MHSLLMDRRNQWWTQGRDRVKVKPLRHPSQEFHLVLMYWWVERDKRAIFLEVLYSLSLSVQYNPLNEKKKNSTFWKFENEWKRKEKLDTTGLGLWSQLLCFFFTWTLYGKDRKDLLSKMTFEFRVFEYSLCFHSSFWIHQQRRCSTFQLMW